MNTLELKADERTQRKRIVCQIREIKNSDTVLGNLRTSKKRKIQSLQRKRAYLLQKYKNQISIRFFFSFSFY